MNKGIQFRLASSKLLRLVIAVIPLVLACRAFNANAQTETNLHSFVGSPNDGANPRGNLVQGIGGNFYGTTFAGGTSNLGTVFQISPSGTETDLYSFVGSPNDGRTPQAGLVQGSDGNFYGTTDFGGTSNVGTVFRISASGNETNLYSFKGYPTDGGNPFGGLVQGSDGNFYGTTDFGGTTNFGTVFRISSSGSYTNLYNFRGYPSDGASPSGGLVQGSDGNIYGTTFAGGTKNSGTVFRISSSGSYTNLYNFRGYPSDGAIPYAGLVQGSDGNFYGTTYAGGTINSGTVFRISSSGRETNIYSFIGSPSDGEEPQSGLVQGSDGYFYGTTSHGGTINEGTVFRISPGGSETNLHSFTGYPNGPDGAYPSYGGLVQGSDGNFYGTTQSGGTTNNGTVFKLTVSLSPPANQIFGIQFFSVFDSTDVAVLIPSVAGEMYQLQYSDSLSPSDWFNTGDTIISIGGPLILTDFPESLPTQRFYRAVITP